MTIQPIHTKPLPTPEEYRATIAAFIDCLNGFARATNELVENAPAFHAMNNGGDAQLIAIEKEMESQIQQAYGAFTMACMSLHAITNK